MLAHILRDVQATGSNGCQSPALRTLFEDFFDRKVASSQRRCWYRLRQFAEYMKMPKDSWIAAIEQLFQSSSEEACQQYVRYRRWLRLSQVNNSGRWIRVETGFGPLARLARERGLIDWSFPHVSQMRSGSKWDGCSPSFQAKAKEWLENLRVRNLAPQSIRTAGVAIRVLGRYLKERGIEYSQVDYQSVSDWIGYLFARKQWSDLTIEGQIFKAKEFFKWLFRRRQVTSNPFDEIGIMKFGRKLPVFLTESEMARLIEGANGSLARALLEFLYATGCRASEASTLNLADLSLESKSIRCMGKGRVERILLFNEATAQALRDYLPIRSATLKKRFRPNETALFIGHFGIRVTPVVIQHAVLVASRRAGIAKRVTPHVCRHSYATHLLNHGADLYSLMTLMGHKSLASTTVYLHVATVRLAEVYRRCHPRK